ncbi:hypothetical protein F444_18263 [Phytophthora nicotianae P1976]|uniref:Uncharacterized protein n=1 Tax=Phytophthora nicotianae P1976 TaxID=1317066 RepID=A0A080ZC08_PHYNI|nr:hypothetical protein F444_18263 [Phytophthora nicotianae P1976]
MMTSLSVIASIISCSELHTGSCIRAIWISGLRDRVTRVFLYDILVFLLSARISSAVFITIGLGTYASEGFTVGSSCLGISAVCGLERARRRRFSSFFLRRASSLVIAAL